MILSLEFFQSPLFILFFSDAFRIPLLCVFYFFVVHFFLHHFIISLDVLVFPRWDMIVRDGVERMEGGKRCGGPLGGGGGREGAVGEGGGHPLLRFPLAIPLPLAPLAPLPLDHV